MKYKGYIITKNEENSSYEARERSVYNPFVVIWAETVSQMKTLIDDRGEARA